MNEAEFQEVGVQERYALWAATYDQEKMACLSRGNSLIC